jgi:ABC-type enterochelin transport system permease subunit
MVIMLMLITYVPWISLVIPNLVYGKYGNRFSGKRRRPVG